MRLSCKRSAFLYNIEFLDIAPNGEALVITSNVMPSNFTDAARHDSFTYMLTVLPFT